MYYLVKGEMPGSMDIWKSDDDENPFILRYMHTINPSKSIPPTFTKDSITMARQFKKNSIIAIDEDLDFIITAATLECL